MNEEKSRAEQTVSPLEQRTTTAPQQPLLSPPPQPPTYQEATHANIATTEAYATAGPATVVVTPLIYGPQALDVQCPYCQNFCRTRLRYEPNSRTHLIALLLCLFQLYCCICVPYCITSCLNVNHYCGMCDKYLGTFKR